MLNYCIVNQKLGPLSSKLWLFWCTDALMHFRYYDIRNLRFAHTSSWPRSQCSFLAAWNSCTTSNKHCWSLATGLQVGLFCSTIQHSHHWAGLDKARAKRRCRYSLEANFPSGVGACVGIIESFRAPPLCNCPHSVFGAWAVSAHEHFPGTKW